MERTDEVYKALLDKGYPEKFCKEIAYKYMNTDYTAVRMLGYLYRVTDPRIEDVVDEMLAILSDRQQIIQKKEMEHAQADFFSIDIMAQIGIMVEETASLQLPDGAVPLIKNQD